jgi:hypothetical protein
VSPVAAQGPPDLSVEGHGGLAVPGSQVTFHLRLLNWTEDIIPDGAITHTLPAGFNYVPGSALVTVGGWPITHTNPISQMGEAGQVLTWRSFQLPAAGHTAHNPYGVHTFVQDLCLPEFIGFQLDQALALVGSGGYVTQLFYRITPQTLGPDPCAIAFVNAAYDRNLVPILRLQGMWNPVGFWEKPDPGPNGDYTQIATAFARYVEGLPRRNTHPLYVSIWNEPDLWVEWSGAPNAYEYGRFFVAVSKAIRRLNDPRIRILNGAVTPANRTFIRRLMTVPGFVTAFDAWASHCYPYNHPPWYNIHRRTARYGNTVIDCYIEERDVIARYGERTGLKFVVTETGHGLGDNLYAFEGFSRITESNRATYMASAFKDYWLKWPEVIAVTPFELGDPWSGWQWLDWIDYTLSLEPFHFSYTPHLQYNTVAALDKPRGATVPHSFEVTFRAGLADDLAFGVYTSDLTGSAGGATAVLTQTASVRVVAHLEYTYLPLIGGASLDKGVWYGQVSADGPISRLQQGVEHPPGTGYLQGASTDGAIRPTHFLGSSSGLSIREDRTAGGINYSFDAEEPELLMLERGGIRAYVGLAGGGLAVLNLRDLVMEERIPLGSELVALSPGPTAGTLYGALSGGDVILVDTAQGELSARAVGLDRPSSLVFDPLRGDLLVADAGQGKIIRFEGNLSARLATYLLDASPDRILLDGVDRRLYVMLPGVGRVLALDADTLRPVAEANLVGGPLIEMALDATRGRVYVLSALSPRYRGIFVLGADDLTPLALVAGSPITPLQQATALTLSRDGQLLVGEGDWLYSISSEDFTIVNQVGLGHPVVRGGLVSDRISGRITWIGAGGVFTQIVSNK